MVDSIGGPFDDRDPLGLLVAAELTPAQAKAYLIADNKSSELAEWDKELLPLELRDLQSMGAAFQRVWPTTITPRLSTTIGCLNPNS
ncbi:MAG: hypothetical protein RIC55_09395 [Pirellulaceae bacterium]